MKETHTLGMFELEGTNVRFQLPQVDSISKLMEWQKSLRDSVTQLVVSRLKPIFIKELNTLPRGDYESKQKLCVFFNDVLLGAELSAVDPKTGKPSTIFASRARESDPGRIYFTRHGRAQTTLGARVEFPLEDIELVKREFQANPFRHR